MELKTASIIDHRGEIKPNALRFEQEHTQAKMTGTETTPSSVLTIQYFDHGG